MATRYLQDANNQLQPVYGAAQQTVQAQVPAVDALYSSLVSGLQQAQTAGTQGVLQSAEQRGVSRANLGNELAGSLGGVVQGGEAQLGADRAAAQSGIAETLTKLGLGGVNARSDLANLFQNSSIASAENQMALDKMNQENALKMLEAERDFNVAKTRAATSRARSAASNEKTAQWGFKNNKNGADGFWFKDARGNPISAATYAKMVGQPVDKILHFMVTQGDRGALRYLGTRGNPALNSKSLANDLTWR